MLEFFQAAFLGFLQGLTEFFPVSSSGHLVLTQALMRRWGIPLPTEDLFFDILLHVATLVVVLAFYRKEIIQILLEWTGRSSSQDTQVPKGSGRKWTGFVVLSTLITTVIALPLEDRIEQAFTSPAVVGFCLFITAGLLLGSEKRAPSATAAGGRPLIWQVALIVGVAQALAVLPGVSRSGATIAAALFCGIGRPQAVAYSFLISIPAILGGFLLKVGDVEQIAWGGALVGMLAAALAGWFALTYLVKLVIRGRLRGFAYYCLTLGTVVLVLSWWGYF